MNSPRPFTGYELNEQLLQLQCSNQCSIVSSKHLLCFAVHIYQIIAYK